jgi:hypothetical protein
MRSHDQTVSTDIVRPVEETNSDVIGAGLGSCWMSPMMSMSSLGNANVAWLSSASSLVHLGGLLVVGAVVGFLAGSLFGSRLIWQCKVGIN